MQAHFHHHPNRRENGASFMGRHHGGRGFGRFVGGFPDGGAEGGGGFRSGRKLASGDLQLIVLALLAEKSQHGYELIKTLEERSGGFYIPSPGMIYPALTYLDEIGHATIEVEGTKKRYHLTEDGRAHLEQNRKLVDAILSQLQHVGSRMEQVRKVFSGTASAGDDDGAAELAAGPRGYKQVWLALRELKMALHDKRHEGSLAEFKRSAEILQRATAEIRGAKA